MIFLRTYCLSLISHYPRSSYPYIITLSYLTRARTLLFCAIHPALSLLVLFSLIIFCLLCVSTVVRQTCSMCVYGLRLKQYLVEIITCLACLE